MADWDHLYPSDFEMPSDRARREAAEKREKARRLAEHRKDLARMVDETLRRLLAGRAPAPHIIHRNGPNPIPSWIIGSTGRSGECSSPTPYCLGADAYAYSEGVCGGGAYRHGKAKRFFLTSNALAEGHFSLPGDE